ncbi:MAG: hypothetical protein KDD83_16595, partial [Caldilineaceae bacterium]|nr:hypothetical protein [Caldilineaceae bacterium]
MSQLDLHLLGPFRARRDGNEVEGIQSNKIRGLLAYLAVEADAVHSRARLATLLWPDLDEPRALGYLRHALTNLRQVLDERNNDPPCLLITRSTLQFNRRSDSVLDVDWLTAFE